MQFQWEPEDRVRMNRCVAEKVRLEPEIDMVGLVPTGSMAKGRIFFEVGWRSMGSMTRGFNLDVNRHQIVHFQWEPEDSVTINRCVAEKADRNRK